MFLLLWHDNQFYIVWQDSANCMKCFAEYWRQEDIRIIWYRTLTWSKLRKDLKKRGKRPGGPESTAAAETGAGKAIEVCGGCGWKEIWGQYSEERSGKDRSRTQWNYRGWWKRSGLEGNRSGTKQNVTKTKPKRSRGEWTINNAE